jgi:hypothetical protein
MDARAAAFLMPLMVAACGGPSVTFEGGVFRAPGVSFRVGDVPSGWQRVKVDDSALGFRDEDGSSVMLDGRCNLKADDVPLVALTNQLVMGATERQYDKEDVIPFDGREARHTVMRAKLDGVPLVWDLYVMKKDGCVYDMAYVAPPDRFERGRGAFERFVAEFHTAGASP